jgi:hypothetical protein
MVHEPERRGFSVAVVVSNDPYAVPKPVRPPGVSKPAYPDPDYTGADVQADVYADDAHSQHQIFKAMLLCQELQECLTQAYDAEDANPRTLRLNEELSYRLRAIHRDLDRLLPENLRSG